MLPPSTESKVSPLKNPRAMQSDSYSTKMKANFKSYTLFSFLFGWTGLSKTHKDDHHDVIIPSKQGTQVTLGAVLTKEDEKNLPPGTVRVSMLTEEEEMQMGYIPNPAVIHMPLLDHGVIDANTGKNITLEEFSKKMQEIKAAEDKAAVAAAAIPPYPAPGLYFHCMAGRSRSQIALVGYLYMKSHMNPPGVTKFDEVTSADIKRGKGMWERFKLLFTGEEALKQEAKELNARLKEHPLPSDIAAYTRAKRPDAKEVGKMDGDQASFLGLMALHQEASGLPLGFLSTDSQVARRVARDIGLMLRAPLDVGFRNKDDRIAQEKELENIYDAYKKLDPSVNLLKEMVVPIGHSSEDFGKCFKALPSYAQVHFAILANGLKEKITDGIDLPSGFSPLDCAKKAVESSKFADKKGKLTAGDQVELLRTFGEECGLKFEDVAKEIMTGSRIDKYNAGIKLAELLVVAKGRAEEGESSATKYIKDVEKPKKVEAKPELSPFDSLLLSNKFAKLLPPPKLKDELKQDEPKLEKDDELVIHQSERLH